ADREVTVRVSGILTAGGRDDAGAVAPLALAQRVAGRPGQAREALVSAVTTPESRLIQEKAFDPARFSEGERDRWYCTNYPSSIAARIQQTLPGVVASPIRRAVETEGRGLSRLHPLICGGSSPASTGSCGGPPPRRCSPPCSGW